MKSKLAKINNIAISKKYAEKKQEGHLRRGCYTLAVANEGVFTALPEVTELMIKFPSASLEIIGAISMPSPPFIVVVLCPLAAAVAPPAGRDPELDAAVGAVVDAAGMTLLSLACRASFR
jgi:hypothetical protein